MKRLAFFALLLPMGLAQPVISNCPSFPANNIWNTRVDSLPVHPSSGAWVSTIGLAAGLRIDDTMPINLANAPPKVTVGNITTPKSDPNPYAIPAGAIVEPGADRHLVVVDTSACILYELYDARLANGHWTA